MTREEFDRRSNAPCLGCGASVRLEHNPNNNATQVVCSNRLCKQQRRPWGTVVNLKTSPRKTRKALPDGQTLDDVWDRWGNICFACGAPKTALIVLGIGRQVHHVLPHAQHGHEGPLVPICTHCHPVVSERQRIYWFIQRLILNGESVSRSGEGIPAPGVSRDSVRAEGETPVGAVEGLPEDDADD